MKMKFMEWNIHGMAGVGNYVIPVHMIMDTIFNIQPDVLVLLEFIEYATGFMDLKNSLEKSDFIVHTTKYKSGSNGVLIAVKNEYISKRMDESAEYLEVGIASFSKKFLFSIIGTRILTQGCYSQFAKRKELFDAIIEKQANKDFIMLFDANNGNIQFEKDKNFIYQGQRSEYNYQQIWREIEDKRNWSLVTPDQGGPYNQGKYSVVTQSDNYGEKKTYHTKEDHLISSFPKKCFSEVDYYWDFVNKYNGYGDRKSEDYLSDLIGLPDHGALVASFELTE